MKYTPAKLETCCDKFEDNFSMLGYDETFYYDDTGDEKFIVMVGKRKHKVDACPFCGEPIEVVE